MNAPAVWAVVRQDLCLATENLSSGLCLAFDYFSHSGDYYPEGINELTCWGEFYRDPDIATDH
jgi:hypothetical protein